MTALKLNGSRQNTHDLLQKNYNLQRDLQLFMHNQTVLVANRLKSSIFAGIFRLCLRMMHQNELLRCRLVLHVRRPQMWSDKSQRFRLNETDYFMITTRRQNCVTFVAAIEQRIKLVKAKVHQTVNMHMTSTILYFAAKNLLSNFVHATWSWSAQKLAKYLNMNLFNHNNSADDCVQLNSCGC